MPSTIVTDRATAERLAADEYRWRTNRDGDIMLLSRGADGGMHYRGDARSRREAHAWVERHRTALVERLLSGDCDNLTVFAGPTGPWMG